MRNIFSKALKAGLLVGTLDISAAFIQYFIRTGKNPVNVLLFIASGVMGNKAFSGGTGTALAGLGLHYFIAFSFTIFFFLVHPWLAGIIKNKILIGIIYGIFIWSVMQFIVLPLALTPKFPFDPVAQLIAALILVICIGLPLAFIAGNSRNRQNS